MEVHRSILDVSQLVSEKCCVYIEICSPFLMIFFFARFFIYVSLIGTDLKTLSRVPTCRLVCAWAGSFSLKTDR